MSLQIKQLEEALGVVLFERSRRMVLLTRAGEAVVRGARRVLSEMEDLVDRAVGRGPLTGRVRFGADPTVAPYLLPMVLPDVRRAYPHLMLQLEERRTEQLLDRLYSGRLDLLLLPLPVDAPGVLSLRLFRERFVVALPPRHPLAGSERVEVEALAEVPMLLLEEGHSLSEQTRKLCPRCIGDVRGTSLGSLVQMVANGLGPTILPSLAVSVEVPPGTEVELRPFVRPSPGREIGLAWRAGSPQESEFRLLGRLLRPG